MNELAELAMSVEGKKLAIKHIPGTSPCYAVALYVGLAVRAVHFRHAWQASYTFLFTWAKVKGPVMSLSF
jgi:hypothetical protein